MASNVHFPYEYLANSSFYDDTELDDSTPLESQTWVRSSKLKDYHSTTLGSSHGSDARNFISAVSTKGSPSIHSDDMELTPLNDSSDVDEQPVIPDLVARSNAGEDVVLSSDSAALTAIKNGFFNAPSEIVDPLSTIVNTTVDTGILSGLTSARATTSNFQPHNMAQNLALSDQKDYDTALFTNMGTYSNFGSLFGPVGKLLGALGAMITTPHNNRTIATDVGNRDADQLTDSF